MELHLHKFLCFRICWMAMELLLLFCWQAFVENNPLIRWCPQPGCERAVRLSTQGPGISSSDPLSFPLLRAPAVDCGKGHLFCWSVLHIFSNYVWNCLMSTHKASTKVKHPPCFIFIRFIQVPLTRKSNQETMFSINSQMSNWLKWHTHVRAHVHTLHTLTFREFEFSIFLQLIKGWQIIK